LVTLPTVLGVITLAFVLIHVAPGDPATLLLGDYTGVTPQVIAELRDQIRGAINDYELGIEPGAGTSALTSEDEEEEEEAEQPAKQPEEELKAQPETAPQP
jgi:ABC-type microcin C transport system permease subunit YejB